MAAATDRGCQGAGLLTGGRSNLRADSLGERDQGRRVEGVGLGQAAEGGGEVAGLAEIDHHHRQSGGDQGYFQAAGGLDDDPFGLERSIAGVMPASVLDLRPRESV